MAQVTADTTVHDVVVIGSGAGGGTMTKVLADLGVSVLLIEAGPMLNPTDLKEHMWPYQAPNRGAGPHAEGLHRRADRLHLQRDLWRGATGRRTLHRGAGQRLLLVPLAHPRRPHQPLRPRHAALWPTTTSSRGSTDGLGWDWPISYDDLAPYYDKAERFIGVTGSIEGIRSAPDGIFNPPAPLRAHDTLVQRACAKLGIRAVAARQAVTTVARNGRPACHYCGQCGRGCKTASNYASSYVQIFPAMQTGSVQVIANAMARELITDDTGKVTAVSYIDKTDRHRKTGALPHGGARGQRVRVGAAAAQLEVAAAPAGARERVRQGRPLPDGHGRARACRRRFPALSGMPHYNSDGYGSHLYVPWWLSDKHKKLNFPRGYHIEVGGGYGMPGIGSFTGSVNRAEGYGLKMKQAIRDDYGTSDRPLRPRRDDPERAVLLRDRSGGEGQLGHPGAPLPLGMERPRTEPGPAHAADLPRDPRRRWAARSPTGGARGGGARSNAGDSGPGRSAGSRRRRLARPARRPGSRTRPPGSRRAAAHSQRQRRGLTGRPPISRGGAIIHEVGTVRMGDDVRPAC